MKFTNNGPGPGWDIADGGWPDAEGGWPAPAPARGRPVRQAGRSYTRNARTRVMEHLRRLERCMCAGAIAAVVVTILEFALTGHKALAAEAASAHMSLTRLVVDGFLGIAAIVGLGLFVVATLWARLRQGRSWYGR